MNDDQVLLRGSGNVFADAGDPDAHVKQLKAQVAAGIIATLNRRELSVDQAADAARVAPEEIQRIRNADLSGLTLDHLVRVAGRLGRHVEVWVVDRPGLEAAVSKGVASIKAGRISRATPDDIIQKAQKRQ